LVDLFELYDDAVTYKI